MEHADSFWPLVLGTIVALLPLINPLAAAPTFLTITEGDSPSRRHHQLVRACVFMVLILVSALVGGTFIMGFFGISIPGLRIAGGLLVGGIGWTMVLGSADSATDEWHRIIALNLTGTYFCLKHEIGAMLATGGGSIVNVASGAAHKGVPGMAAYSASKHGVIGLTRTAAAEYAGAGVRVNAVNPGIINTEAYARHGIDYNALLPTPMGRIAEPEEVANAAAWFFSDQAPYVTGQSLDIDGGRTTAAFVMPPGMA